MTINYLRNSDIKHVIFRPHNVYGPKMGFEHVLPDLIKKIYDQSNLNNQNNNKIDIEIQGDGSDTRAFIYIDDAINAIKICTLSNQDSGIFHVGNNEEISIEELVDLIAKVMNINISIIRSNRPSGSTSRRCPDNNKIVSLGYRKVNLVQGLKKTIDWYWSNYSKGKGE